MAKPEEQEADLGEYTDYLLLSSRDLSQGWKQNIMRLAPSSASEAVDYHHWTSVKLNRRDQRRIRIEEERMARKAAFEAAEAEAKAKAEAEALARGEQPGQLPGPSDDIKPGMPGYNVKEKEERDESLVAPGPSGTTSSTANRPKRGFGAPKKTRRVFTTEESQKNRRIRFEEQHPWVLETVDNKKPANETRWIGKMDASASAVANGGEGSAYALLVLDTNAGGNEAAFKVVPANRWYRFTSRPRYHTMNPEEAEEVYKQMQKSGDMDSFFAQRRINPSTSAAGAQAGRSHRGPDSFLSNGTAQSGGYRSRFAQARRMNEDQASYTGKFRTVVGESSVNDEDGWNEAQDAGPAGMRAGQTKVQPRRRGGAADDEYEEFEFEETFQDDEEGIGQVGDDALDDEDNKELEERIKREMRAANNYSEAMEDFEDDEEQGQQLTKAGQRVKKILKKRGRKGRPDDEEDDIDDDDDDDDDDEDKNPYLSEEDEEDSETERERLAAEEAKRNEIRQQQAARSAPAMGRTGSAGLSGPRMPGASAAPSRSGSAGPPSRAASPSAPVNKAAAAAARGPGSPSGLSSRAVSPTPPPSATKRKAEEGQSPSGGGGTSGAAGTSKRRKPGSPSPAPASAGTVTPADDSALIPRSEIIAFIRDKTPTTKELLRHFKAAMGRDARNKSVILQVTKEVATIVDGKLSVKAGFA